MRRPEIELWWWEGCPSTERALAEVRQVLSDLGLEIDVRLREIETDADAQSAGFKGSPTIVIDGNDLVTIVDGADADAAEPVGLSCRVYRRRDGRISPTPDPDDVREALRRATAQEEV